MDYLPIYCKHLAVLVKLANLSNRINVNCFFFPYTTLKRTFARSVPNAKSNTYKKFEIWIRDNSTGEPPVLNIEAIAAADEQYQYSIPTTIPDMSSPIPVYMSSPNWWINTSAFILSCFHLSCFHFILLSFYPAFILSCFHFHFINWLCMNYWICKYSTRCTYAFAHYLH